MSQICHSIEWMDVTKVKEALVDLQSLLQPVFKSTNLREQRWV